LNAQPNENHQHSSIYNHRRVVVGAVGAVEVVEAVEAVKVARVEVWPQIATWGYCEVVSEVGRYCIIRMNAYDWVIDGCVCR
jgi:hypothetical protein